MKINLISKIKLGQDGAIWNGYLFRFDSDGSCGVYSMDKVHANGEPIEALSTFYLDRIDELRPHSNAVVFSNEYYEEGDEFPLLYSNVYNNYAASPRKLKGVCLVYRLVRNGNEFTTTLVGMVEIGFVDDYTLWGSCDEDVRPFGNFAIDRDTGLYWAFNMRDKAESSRYFSFRLPPFAEWQTDDEFGIKHLVLTPEDIIEYFDVPYHNYVQGACAYGGKVYSTEGFTNSQKAPAAIRVISCGEKREELCVRLADYGIDIEPELIDFYKGVCYYSDNLGNLYTIEF